MPDIAAQHLITAFEAFLLMYAKFQVNIDFEVTYVCFEYTQLQIFLYIRIKCIISHYQLTDMSACLINARTHAEALYHLMVLVR